MIIDNKTSKIADHFKSELKNKTRLSLISSMFSLFAYEELKQELKKLEQFRLILPDNGKADNINGILLSPFGVAGSIVDRDLRNKLNVAQIARECAEWITAKGEIKTTAIPVPYNLFHFSRQENKEIAIHGSSPFSTEGLGLKASDSFHMNTGYDNPVEAGQLINWFDSLWNNDQISSDAKREFLKLLETIYSEKSPKFVYFYVLTSIFKEFLQGFNEDGIIKTRTGIKDTVIWNKLYKFQRDGVLGAIEKIENYNGCIIADSVGLGKTFEALAIIKYYELRNDRVLVLCPKRLRENWTLYTINDTRNILVKDRFNFDVLNHTDLSRYSGRSGEINLETINWGNYDLVVIDESHNFRNNPPRKDGLTRYSRLMNDIIRSGVKTKVLMLSATPVNNRMNDLKNQVAFINEGRDDALYNSGITSIELTLSKAQKRFNQWLRLEDDARTSQALLDSLNFDYFKLLDLLTIARSRKHIQKYYSLADIGEFPERLAPINIKVDIDTENSFPPLREINRDIRRLNLSSYTPLKYLLPDKVEEYGRKYDMEVSGGGTFRQTDREQSLIHLLRVNLFKRMESSINSFYRTVEKLQKDIQSLINRIESHEDVELDDLSIEEIEIEDEAFSPYLAGEKVKVLIKDVDRIKWMQELEEDNNILVKLLRESRAISVDRDAKLQSLKDLIRNKINNPLNSGNRKIVIFTAFADTARYLYENINQWAIDSLRVNSALVTGTGDNKTTMKGARRDLASILTSFSPVSKERAVVSPEIKEEIDILIATDCISEGQNLQDCDFLVNYDIHWNPVRIIQRFGRIDRLGSRNEVIQLVNFWPNMELDEYINLEARVSGKMVLLDISATGEENIIEFSDSSVMNDLEYRRKQLERLQHEVVNLEDINEGISITDLTLNDFRMDIADYYLENKNHLDRMPPGIFSVTAPDEFVGLNITSGAIFCLYSDNPSVHRDSTYALAPYYLVYVSDDGEVIQNYTHIRQILDIFKKLTIGRSSPDTTAIERFQFITKHGRDMSHYQRLLSIAVSAITGKAEERGVETLFSRGGTVISKDSFKGINDFEVIAFLVIPDGSER